MTDVEYLCEDFSLVERDLFPLFCTPFVIADRCREPVLGGSGQHWGQIWYNESGSDHAFPTLKGFCKT